MEEVGGDLYDLLVATLDEAWKRDSKLNLVIHNLTLIAGKQEPQRMSTRMPVVRLQSMRRREPKGRRRKKMEGASVDALPVVCAHVSV